MRSTLYEFAGGAPASLALATAHRARCLADPELAGSASTGAADTTSLRFVCALHTSVGAVDVLPR